MLSRSKYMAIMLTFLIVHSSFSFYYVHVNVATVSLIITFLFLKISSIQLIFKRYVTIKFASNFQLTFREKGLEFLIILMMKKIKFIYFSNKKKTIFENYASQYKNMQFAEAFFDDFQISCDYIPDTCTG
jgi:hypothetical protein